MAADATRSSGGGSPPSVEHRLERTVADKRRPKRAGAGIPSGFQTARDLCARDRISVRSPHTPARRRCSRVRSKHVPQRVQPRSAFANCTVLRGTLREKPCGTPGDWNLYCLSNRQSAACKPLLQNPRSDRHQRNALNQFLSDFALGCLKQTERNFRPVERPWRRLSETPLRNKISLPVTLLDTTRNRRLHRQQRWLRYGNGKNRPGRCGPVMVGGRRVGAGSGESQRRFRSS